MANILTATEAANVLRTLTTDAEMLAILPLVDEYVKNATGRDWTADATIHPAAKSAARMLLVMYHENPGMMANGQAPLGYGLSSALVQLEGIARRYRTFQGRENAGAIELPGVEEGDTVSSVVGVVGVTGSQASMFETLITIDGEIQQVSTSDLSANWYRAYILSPEEL